MTVISWTAKSKAQIWDLFAHGEYFQPHRALIKHWIQKWIITKEENCKGWNFHFFTHYLTWLLLPPFGTKPLREILYLIVSWIFHLKQESRGQGGGWKLAQQFWHALYPLQEKYREKVLFEIRSAEYSILLQWKNTRTRQDSKLSSKSNLSDKDGAAEKKRRQKTSKL